MNVILDGCLTAPVPHNKKLVLSVAAPRACPKSDFPLGLEDMRYKLGSEPVVPARTTPHLSPTRAP